MRWLGWPRRTKYSVSREEARELAQNPPELPDPFQYAAGTKDRFVARLDKDRVWKGPIKPDAYPAPERFKNLDELERWEEVLEIDRAATTLDRNDNVGLLGGFMTGGVFAFMTALVDWSLGDYNRAGWESFAAALAVVLSLCLVDIPYKRMERLDLIQLHYARRRKEFEAANSETTPHGSKRAAHREVDQ